ncbi:Hypothetical protein FKW44_013888 [Caligus rogercresseyi]|uniref:Uncharacterized protein n=1 Tax=Caligus rogercresseyi TaxID=217165 RepID=A0A7T8JYL2_CALRO|nr:Hypothetical protein FKW44_013888 [Caligus rogercresseyi]
MPSYTHHPEEQGAEPHHHQSQHHHHSSSPSSFSLLKAYNPHEDEELLLSPEAGTQPLPHSMDFSEADRMYKKCAHCKNTTMERSSVLTKKNPE